MSWFICAKCGHNRAAHDRNRCKQTEMKGWEGRVQCSCSGFQEEVRDAG